MRLRSVLILCCWCLLVVAFPAFGAEQLVVEPDQIPAFVDTCVGQNAPHRPVTLENTSGGPVTVNEITVDPPGSDFEVLGFGEPQTIEDGKTFPFQISFKPTAPGNRTATLKFSTQPQSEDPGDRDLVGRGVTRVIEVAPASLTFGDQRSGTRSAAKQLSIRNTGSHDLTITRGAISGGHASDFRLSPPLNAEVLNPGEAISVGISFQPRIAGKRTTSLSITSNACAGATKTVPITGTGIAPEIRIDPPVVDLGQVPLGTPSERIPLVVSNDGKAPLKVSQIQVVGADAADFAFEALPTLPRIVAAGDSFLLNVIFTPSADGTRRAGARVTSDDPGRPIFEITLTGVGGAASIPPTASPTATASATATSIETVPPPRASGTGGSGSDWIAILLVVVLVAGAFAGLVVLKRARGEQG